MVEAMLALGRSLRMDVIAEGIEHGSQADQLRQLGCDEGQGFLFSRPLPVDELRRHLADVRRDSERNAPAGRT
jgi:EAL domain-containing protein (putative c-di-GMP-specific phosphodiesterase class I)